MPCPRISVVAESGSTASKFFVSLNKAIAMFSEGYLRENVGRDGRVIANTAVFVSAEDRSRQFIDKGYDEARYGRDSGPHRYSVRVPAEFEIADCSGLFASDVMPCHPVRWGLSS
jgi:hypothetical protein